MNFKTGKLRTGRRYRIVSQRHEEKLPRVMVADYLSRDEWYFKFNTNVGVMHLHWTDILDAKLSSGPIRARRIMRNHLDLTENVRQR